MIHRRMFLQRVKKGYRALGGIVVFLLLAYATGSYLWSRQEMKRALQKQKELELLFYASEELHRLWSEGDQNSLWASGKMSCLEELGPPAGIDDDYLRCNPNFLQCYLSYLQQANKPHFIRQEKNQKNSISALKIFPAAQYFFSTESRYYEIIARASREGLEIPSYAVRLRLQVEGGSETLDVLLEDVCHDTYLPERIYGLGPRPKDIDNDWRFDTFGQSIYVDKFPVSNLDIAQWINADPEHPLRTWRIKPEYYSWPATGLTPQQMQDYCAFRGKELLTGPILDAASFHPTDESIDKPLKNLRGPYPGSRMERKSFLYDALNKKNFEFSDQFCRQVYTHECLGLSYSAYYPSAISWIGIFQTLGGVMEMTRNPLGGPQVKASSSYFDADSPWHALGQRVLWEGPGFYKENFQWTPIDSDSFFPPDTVEPLKMGFRCMTYVLGESGE
jgi:hypothetical protein